MKRTLFLFLVCNISGWAAAQTKSPEEFLGYKLGERFTPHHKIVAYFEHVAEENSNVQLQFYGETYEKRPLLLAFISSEKNIGNLESIRLDNLRRAGMLAGSPQTKIPVTWLSYNVHGNEAVSSEAALKTLWALVDPAETDTKTWLENNLVVMDPCINPDGRDRYVNWYNQKMNRQLQPDPQSIEHQEPWPGGRGNHYFFDLNRDWAWQVQKESRQRVLVYHQWMPQLHLDFHEQGVDQPYYFPPAAAPQHHLLSPFQHEFQETFGRNTAKYFDENNWFYFTKEVFDLLYPSYGDAWPMYNGAIGMTIEQAGSGRAGVGIINAEGDTLTLRDRIQHHYTTGLSAVETAALHAERLLDEFGRYFSESSTNPKGKYKSFVIRADNPPARIEQLVTLLDKNGIRYGMAGREGKYKGFDYGTGRIVSFEVAGSDIIVSAFQPKSVLTQVLFEPEPTLDDSVTYDITSWSLPYAFGLDAFAVESRIEAQQEYIPGTFEPVQADQKPLAYLAPWNAGKHAVFLAALLREGIRVRYAEYAFETGGEHYPAGSLIITRGGNEYIRNFDEKVAGLANKMAIRLGTSTSGLVDKGPDFGSSRVKTVFPPKIALFSGEDISSLNFGEIWHYFEQELEYPISILNLDQIASADLDKYTILIMPSGDYEAWGEKERKKLHRWVKSGGKLLAIEAALEFFSEHEDFGLAEYLNQEEKNAQQDRDRKTAETERTAPYQDRERLAISDQAMGAVFEVAMDTTYALGFGTGGKFYTLRNSSQRYAYLKEGVNAGIIPTADRHRTGFIGYRAKSRIGNSMVFGVESVGEGKIIYMADNPIFRGFWENGKLILSNALFLVQ